MRRGNIDIMSLSHDDGDSSPTRQLSRPDPTRRRSLALLPSLMRSRALLLLLRPQL
eukprot:COSAG06_NODE_1198_length_10303_cov_40.587319_7_plen_56_part_00